LHRLSFDILIRKPPQNFRGNAAVVIRTLGFVDVKKDDNYPDPDANFDQLTPNAVVLCEIIA